MHGIFRKTALLIGVITGILYASCDDETLAFDITTSSSSTIEKVDFCPPDIGISLPEQILRAVEAPIQEAMSQIGPAIDNEVEKRNTGPVKHIYMKALTMTMKEPPAESERKRDNTLGFLSKVEVYVSMDGKDELLAESAKIAENAVSVSFRTYDVDLKPYVDKGFSTKVKVTARYCPSVDIPMDVTTTTRVSF